MRDYSLEAPYGLINGCQTNKADNVSETQGSPLFEPDFTYSTTPSHSISPFLWPSPNDLFPFDYDGDFSNSTGLQVHDDYSQFDLPVFGNFSIMPAPFYDYEQFPLGDFQHIPETYLPSLVLHSPSPLPSCEITYDTHLTALTPTSPIIPASIEIRSIQTQKPAERIGSTQIRSASSLRRRSGHKKLFYCPFEGCGSTMTSKINHQGAFLQKTLVQIFFRPLLRLPRTR